MKKHDFKNKKVLITGASMGIGRALAFEFAKRGAHLALCALPRDNKLLESLAGELKKSYGIKTWIFPIDLTEKDGPDHLHRDVKKEVGDIYALVNNAGTIAYGKFWEIPLENQEQIYRINFLVPLKLMRLFIGDMVKKKEGVVFNTSSVSGLQPTPFHSVYGATKAGLQSLSEGVRIELRGTGVSVCTLNPSYVETALVKVKGFPKKMRWYMISGLARPEWVAKKALVAFEKDTFLYVPGMWAKFLHLFLIKISSRRLVNFLAYYSLQGVKKQGHY